MAPRSLVPRMLSSCSTTRAATACNSAPASSGWRSSGRSRNERLRSRRVAFPCGRPDGAGLMRVPFTEMMEAARRGNYAVGYFESWNLESLLAVADAAEATRSPVILGFSGLYLPHKERTVSDRLAPYAAMASAVADGLAVPACIL